MGNRIKWMLRRREFSLPLGASVASAVGVQLDHYGMTAGLGSLKHSFVLNGHKWRRGSQSLSSVNARVSLNGCRAVVIEKRTPVR